MAHMGTRPGNTQWLFCASSLVEMFGQYRSGAVNGCVCAGSCQLVKCCLFPIVEIIFRDKVLIHLFSEFVSAELPFPHAAAWLSGVFRGLGWLQTGWISSFLTWDSFLGFVPSSSYSFLTFMLHFHNFILQPQLPLFFLSPFLQRFPLPPPPPFPSIILPFLADWLLLLSVMSPLALLSIWSFLPLFQCFGVEYLCFPSLSYLAACLLLISCSLGSWQVALPVVSSFLAQRQSSLGSKERLGII